MALRSPVPSVRDSWPPYVTLPEVGATSVATLVVDGFKFDDWDSVLIQHQFAEAWPFFRFTAVERDPDGHISGLIFRYDRHEEHWERTRPTTRIHSQPE